PGDARLADERFEELWKGESVATVAPIVREILRDEVHLARTLRLEKLCLAYQFIERERTVLAAHQRDRTEGAAVVAPLAHLQIANVRIVGGGEEQPGWDPRLVVDQSPCLEFGKQAVHLGRAEEEVDLRQRLDQLV